MRSEENESGTSSGFLNNSTCLTPAGRSPVRFPVSGRRKTRTTVPGTFSGRMNVFRADSAHSKTVEVGATAQMPQLNWIVRVDTSRANIGHSCGWRAALLSKTDLRFPPRKGPSHGNGAKSSDFPRAPDATESTDRVNAPQNVPWRREMPEVPRNIANRNCDNRLRANRNNNRELPRRAEYDPGRALFRPVVELRCAEPIFNRWRVIRRN